MGSKETLSMCEVLGKTSVVMGNLDSLCACSTGVGSGLQHTNDTHPSLPVNQVQVHVIKLQLGKRILDCLSGFIQVVV